MSDCTARAPAGGCATPRCRRARAARCGRSRTPRVLPAYTVDDDVAGRVVFDLDAAAGARVAEGSDDGSVAAVLVGLAGGAAAHVDLAWCSAAARFSSARRGVSSRSESLSGTASRLAPTSGRPSRPSRQGMHSQPPRGSMPAAAHTSSVTINRCQSRTPSRVSGRSSTAQSAHGAGGQCHRSRRRDRRRQITSTPRARRRRNSGSA